MVDERLDAWLRSWSRDAPDRLFLTDAVARATYREIDAAVDAEAAAMTAASGAEPVAITGLDRIDAIVEVLAAMRASIPVVLIPPGLTQEEETHVIDVSGAYRRTARGGDRPSEVRERSGRSAAMAACGAALAFVTSGTTGRSRLALRSAPSLAQEGLRYRDLLNLTEADVVLAALPLCHAYAFGAGLCAALVSGASLALHAFRGPRDLVRRTVEVGATFLPLVSQVARVLAMSNSEVPVGHRLRVAMVGAGPVVPETARAFSERWRLELAQNYGSSETGAVLASFGSVAAGATGFPMPHVECELGSLEGDRAQLWVRSGAPPLGHLDAEGLHPARLAPGGWWPTGDLFRRAESGALAHVGRVGRLIRRGGHTIDPAEVERAIASLDGVEDVLVYERRQADRESSIVAQLVVRAGAKSPTAADVRSHAANRIAAYKLPNELVFSSDLRRNWIGKPVAPPPVERAAAPAERSVRSPLHAYRGTEALLAASEVGMLDALRRSAATPDDLAGALELDSRSVSVFLRVLEAAGVTECADGRWSLVPSALPRGAVLDYEARLRRTWLSCEEIVEVLRRGTAARRFDLEPMPPDLARSYVAALCGDWVAPFARSLLVRREGDRPPRVVEIGRGVGTLARIAAAQDGAGSCSVISLPPGPPLTVPGLTDAIEVTTCAWPFISIPPGSVDLVFVFNGIHWLPEEQAPGRLRSMIEALAPGGRLVVVDLFLDEDRGAASTQRPDLVELDWLTHGGLNITTRRQLVQMLETIGNVRISQGRVPATAFSTVSVTV